MITTRSTHCPRIGARMAAANHSCKFPPPGRTYIPCNTHAPPQGCVIAPHT
jgi:hypothetical protein